MISFFTVPKAFKDHIGIIQENAINSWLKLTPKPDIFLLGNEDGTGLIAKKYNLHHIKNIAYDQNSVPFLNSIFQQMHSSTKNAVLCYINTDIILFDDFIKALQKIISKFSKYLIISSRWNLDVANIIDFSNSNITATLRKEAFNKRDMYPAAGSDFFVFPKNVIFKNIPPFLLGRGYWDNWLMCQAKKEGALLIDITADVIALHQNHDYSHVLTPSPREANIKTICKTQEGKSNFRIAGGHKNIYCAYDADFVLSNGMFCSTWNIKYIDRRLKAFLRRIISILKDKLHVKSRF